MPSVDKSAAMIATVLRATRAEQWNVNNLLLPDASIGLSGTLSGGWPKPIKLLYGTQAKFAPSFINP